MNPLIMKALFEGAALLIGSFARTAAKNGLAIMLLVIMSGGMAWFAYYQRGQFLQILNANKTECRAEVDSLKTRLEHCEAVRREHEIRIAVLETIMRAQTKESKHYVK